MDSTIKNLVEVIKKRKISKSDKSYTYSLLNKGLDKCTDKLEEEFFEFKNAAKEKQLPVAGVRVGLANPNGY